MTEQYKRFGKNTLIVFVGSFGSKLISFLLLPLYTRWLSVEEYGTADLVSSYAALLLVLVSACIMDAIFVFPKGAPKDQQTKFFTSSLAFCFSTIALSGGVLYALQSLDFDNTFCTYAVAIWAIMSSSTLQSITQQFARSIDKMMVFGATGIMQTLCLFAFSFLLIPSYGVKGYIAAIGIANIATAIFTLLLSKGYEYIRLSALSRDHLKQMLQYSIPLIPANVMFWLIGTINRPIMESHCGLFIIGLYAIAMKIVSVVGVVSNIMLTSWQISVLEEYGKESYEKFYNRIINAFTTLLVVVFLVLSMFSPLVLRIISTEEFYEASRYVPMLLLGTIIATFSNFISANFLAVRKSKYIFYSSIYSAASAVALNFILIPTLGIWGALISYVASFVVMAVTRVIYSWQYVKLTNIWFIAVMLGLGLTYCLLDYKLGNGWITNTFGAVVSIILIYKAAAPIMDYINSKRRAKASVDPEGE